MTPQVHNDGVFLSACIRRTSSCKCLILGSTSNMCPEVVQTKGKQSVNDSFVPDPCVNEYKEKIIHCLIVRGVLWTSISVIHKDSFHGAFPLNVFFPLFVNTSWGFSNYVYDLHMRNFFSLPTFLTFLQCYLLGMTCN